MSFTTSSHLSRLRPGGGGGARDGGGRRVAARASAGGKSRVLASSSFTKPPGRCVDARRRAPVLPRLALSSPELIRVSRRDGRRACRVSVAARAHADPHEHSHGCCGPTGGGSRGRPSFREASDKDARSRSHGADDACCVASSISDVDGSFDEAAFISETGTFDTDASASAGGAAAINLRGPGGSYDHNAIEAALTAVYRFTRIGYVADVMRGNAALCVVSWIALVVGGVAHACGHLGVATSTTLAVETAATALVYVLSGTSEFVDVTYELAVGNVNIHVLTTLAVLGTVLLGCALEGGLLLVLFATATFVETRLTRHARGDLKELWATVPGEATTIELNADGSGPDVNSSRTVNARDVTVGTNVFVKAGQQVPLDGVVVHGSALVSIQHITGEALPVTKRVGDEIPAGALNSDGALVVRSIRSAEDSTPARIARLTEAAQARRPAVSRLLDTFGDRYSKAILGVTAATMILGPLIWGLPLLGRAGAMYRAFAFLSAAAPCALLMSPLVYVAAVGACARRGVLVRGGVTFDALAECGTVALDKTGTITTGVMTCAAIERESADQGNNGSGAGGTPRARGELVEAVAAAAARGGSVREAFERSGFRSSSEASTSAATATTTTTTTTTIDASPGGNLTALAIVAALERGATHPIARAVMDTASAHGPDVPEVIVSNFRVVAGKGVEGYVSPGGGGGGGGGGRLARFGAVEWATEIIAAEAPATAAALRRRAGAGGNVGGSVTATLVVSETHRNPSSELNGGLNGYGADDLRSNGTTWDASSLSSVFRFADSLHPKAADSVAKLAAGKWRDDGMRLLMLTGDNEQSARAISDAVGLPPNAVNASLTPGDKLRIVEEAREEAIRDETRMKKGVAMVGDGINDAPALAAADVGIAVATTPSEAAAAAADVLLLHADADGISQLPELFELAARTRAVLRQNITLAVVSILGSALPALVGAFPLWLAVLLHEGSTLLVAINSVRLLGTFGRQPLRKSTLLATLGVFAACCAGGYWCYAPSARLALRSAVGVALTTPQFIAASLALKSAWAGLLAGCLHTLTGPDHLAALAPLSVGPNRAKNAAMGALWGLGHNTGQILFGLIFVLLKDKLPFNMEIIGQWGQGIVGATLIAIGALGFWEAREMAEGRSGHSHSHSHSHGLPFGLGGDMFGDDHAHSHSHSHDDGDVVAKLKYAHSHANGEEAGRVDCRDEDDDGEVGRLHSHSHSDSDSDSHSHSHASSSSSDGAPQRGGANFLSWTYLTGTIHGLQPDALLLLLPAFALPRLQAIAFLGTFFVGTIVAMGTYTACLGAGTSALQKHNPKAVSLVSSISSFVAVAIGFALIASAIFGFEIF